MNKAQIIEMAKACGFAKPSVTIGLDGMASATLVFKADKLEAFAQLVADHALEDAARTCEARAKDAPAPLAAECLLCAVAIRAMKGKP